MLVIHTLLDCELFLLLELFITYASHQIGIHNSVTNLVLVYVKEAL